MRVTACLAEVLFVVHVGIKHFCWTHLFKSCGALGFFFSFATLEWTEQLAIARMLLIACFYECGSSHIANDVIKTLG